MALARVTAKGQVTIPAEIRKTLEIAEGDALLFEIVEPGVACVRVLKRQCLTDLYGVLPARRPYPGKEAIRAEVGQALGEQMASPEP